MHREDPITEKIIGCAIEVHRNLGPGLLESVDQECLEYELRKSGLAVECQVAVPIHYKELSIGSDLRLDLLVNESVILEIKAVEKLLPIHEAQLLTDLKLSDHRIGLLINFNVPLLKDGLKRLAN